MDNLGEVLRYLREKEDFVSGDYISGRLRVSRTSVWKYMNQLGNHGYTIAKSKGKGYKLAGAPDMLFPWEVDRYGDTVLIGKKIIHHESVESTNAVAFKLAMAGEPEGTCVIAESQTKGKGRLGRKWSSPVQKNIYVSVILRPSIHPSLAYPLTFLSSLAVYDTIHALTGLTPSLKWPNDVLLNGKKICGTLLELSTEADAVRFVVIGIGLNVNMVLEDLDDEIRHKATSLLIETKKVYERAQVCGMLLSNLEKYYLHFGEGRAICREWEETASIKGKYMEINQMGESHKGTAEGIDVDGAILLNIDGKIRRVIAGDVSF